LKAKRPRSIGLTVAGATLLAAFLRFFRIGVQSFWDDEVATLRAAGLTLKQIWHDIPIIDSNPPLIYTLLHFWRQLGESEWIVRSLPALFGVLAIPVCYALLRRLIGSTRAAVASLLLAINPLAIYCGQETRYNTMVTFFALVAVWAFVRTVEKPRWTGVVALTTFTSLALYSHYFFFFVLAAMVALTAIFALRLWRSLRLNLGGLTWLGTLALKTRSFAVRAFSLHVQAVYFSLVRRHARGLAYAAIGLTLAALSFVPFLKYFTIQLLRGVHWREPLGLLEVLRRIVVWLFIGHSVTAPPTFISPLQKFSAAHETLYGLLLFTFVLPLIGLALAGLLRYDGRRRNITLGAMIVVPILGVLTVSRLTPIFDPRYMLPFVPFVLGALAAGLVDLWQGSRRWLAVVMAAWLLLLTGFSLKDYYYSPAHWRQDWRGLAERVTAETGPDSTVLFYNFYTSLAFLHYLEKQDDPPPVQYLYVLEERFGPLEVKRRRLRSLIGSLAQQRRRIWLVDYHGYMDDPYDDARQELRAHDYRRFSRQCWMPGLWRYCLERWSTHESDWLASLFDDVDFAKVAPGEHQLIAGWYEGEGPRRWIADKAQVRFTRPAGQARLHVRFYANLDYLGGSLTVRVSIDGEPLGDIAVSESKIVDWQSKPFMTADDQTTTTVTLTPNHWFVPDELLGDGDRSKKSILVERVALEAVDE